MTRFYVTPEQHDLVSEALGSDWKHDNLYGGWSKDFNCVYRGETSQAEFYVWRENGHVEVIMNVDWASFCLGELEQVLAIVRDVENRLRAAGLREVEE